MIFVWGIATISLIAAQFIAKIFLDKAFVAAQGLVSNDMFEHLTQSNNWGMLLQIAGLVFIGATFIVIISSILTCINIVRFEPLKIFNKQYK